MLQASPAARCQINAPTQPLYDVSQQRHRVSPAETLPLHRRAWTVIYLFSTPKVLEPVVTSQPYEDK